MRPKICPVCGVDHWKKIRRDCWRAFWSGFFNPFALFRRTPTIGATTDTTEKKRGGK